MSAEKRNEMLAQGRCFTYGEVGHLARNCPTTTNVVSEEKGKPPGFGLHTARFSSAAESASYESTEVLDTLPIGAIGLAFDAEDVVEEGGEFNAELALEMGQPYPGENTEFNQNERRFCVYRISDTQYVVIDSMFDLDHLIDDPFFSTPALN
ncbi:hypothetical protein B0H13DRAFT_2333002 [Mycena leptocephala]|nr:hypothetical protein B0H13DRAFT_2333002 [Mycena leptocephala]